MMSKIEILKQNSGMKKTKLFKKKTKIEHSYKGADLLIFSEMKENCIEEKISSHFNTSENRTVVLD